MMADMFIKNYDVKGFLKFDIPKPPAWTTFLTIPWFQLSPVLQNIYYMSIQKGKNKIDQKHSPGFPHDAP